MNNNENYVLKTKSVRVKLKEIYNKKKLHYKKYIKYKKIFDKINVLIHSLNSISVCSLILALGPTAPVALIVSLTSTSISGIIAVGVTSFNLRNKIELHHTAYLEYGSLYRDYDLIIKKNNLTSID